MVIRDMLYDPRFAIFCVNLTIPIPISSHLIYLVSCELLLMLNVYEMKTCMMMTVETMESKGNKKKKKLKVRE